MTSSSGLTPLRAFFILLLLGSLTLFFGAGRVPLLGADEPRYAEIAREMWVSGDYIVPRLAGKIWLEKAPLLYWGQAFFYSFLGANELAARLPSAFGAFFLTLGLWATARRILGERSGLYIAAVAASMLAIIVFAHGASTDMTLCAMLGGAMLCLWQASQSPRAARWILATAAFTAGAMLAKGLIGPLLVVLVSGIWCAWARPRFAVPPRLLPLVLLAAVLLFFAVSAIWYWPVWATVGRYFWEEFFVHHHFKRYTTNEYNHPQPFYFFFFIALIGALPWTAWLFPAALGIRGLRPRTDKRDALLAFAWVWALVPIAFFSLSGSKLPSYILPSFPALAIIAGEGLARGVLLPRGVKPKWVLLGGASLMALVVVIAFAFYGPRHEEKLSTRALCLQVLTQMKPGEKATFYDLSKDYDPVFYLQGRVIPGPGLGVGKRDIYYAQKPAELVPLLKNGSLIVFTRPQDAIMLESNATFSAQLLGEQPKVRAYRLKLR